MKKKYIIISISLLIVISIGIFSYYKFIYKESVLLPLSEVIELSKTGTFKNAEMKGTILELEVASYKEQVSSINTDGKYVSLTAGDKVKTDISYLNLADLTDIGFKLPIIYKNGSTELSNNWTSLVSPILLIGGLLFVLYLLYGTNLLAGGTRKFNKSKSSITFDDIGGLFDVKRSMLEVVDMFKNKDKMDALGIKIHKGLLLTGEPGTGKTMIAKSIANMAKIQFLYASASDFNIMWYGMAAQRVKKLFKEAKRKPSIIFIDEFESIAQKRRFSGSDVSQDKNSSLNQLLTEMDGFKDNENVLVIAATNHPEVLDEAVLRPGRFDRKITIYRPTLKERIEIIKIHLGKKILDSDITIEEIAKYISGFTGADIAALLNESAILAVNDNSKTINKQHIYTALDKLLAGDARVELFNNLDKKLIATHEAGHAIIALNIPQYDSVNRVSIIPRGDYGGFTYISPENDNVLITKTKALKDITVLFGGIVAEQLFIGDISSSARNDIERANKLAYDMVCNLGMGDKTQLRNINSDNSSDSVKNNSDYDINNILGNCKNNAETILKENEQKHKEMVIELVNKEILEKEQLDKYKV